MSVISTIDGQKRFERSYVEQENAYFSVFWRFLAFFSCPCAVGYAFFLSGGAVLPIYDKYSLFFKLFLESLIIINHVEWKRLSINSEKKAGAAIICGMLQLFFGICEFWSHHRWCVLKFVWYFWILVACQVMKNMSTSPNPSRRAVKVISWSMSLNHVFKWFFDRSKRNIRKITKSPEHSIGTPTIKRYCFICLIKVFGINKHFYLTHLFVHNFLVQTDSIAGLF